MKIILVDWAGYPLYRVKPFGENTIYCGLGLILDNLTVFNGGVEFRVIIVITGCDVDEKKQKFYENELAKYRFIERIIFRSNEGKDIGSYNCGFKYLKNNGYEGNVLFMNSSVSGPNRNGWLLEYKNLFHSQAGIGLCGIAMNNLNRGVTEESYIPTKPHVQSFFLYSSMDVLRQVFDSDFPGFDIPDSKAELIAKGEIEISTRILENNYSLCCLPFPNFIYKKGDLWDIPFCLGYRTKKQFGTYVNKI